MKPNIAFLFILFLLCIGACQTELNKPSVAYIKHIAYNYPTETVATDTTLLHLFDNNANTDWKISKQIEKTGSLSIVFYDSIAIEKLLLRAEKPASKNCTIVINNTVEIPDSGNDTLLIGQNVKSLLLKWRAKPEFQIVDSYFRMAEEAKHIRMGKFMRSDTVSISEIMLFDKKNNRIMVKNPMICRAKIKTPQALSPEHAYGKQHLFDLKKENAFIAKSLEDATKQRFDFYFDSAVTISGLELLNGYQRSKSLFDNNLRIQKIIIGCHKTFFDTLDIKNTIEPQHVALKKPRTSQHFFFIVDSVYEAKFDNLAISEFYFYNDKQLIIILPKNRYKIKENNEKPHFTGKALKNYTNRNNDNILLEKLCFFRKNYILYASKTAYSNLNRTDGKKIVWEGNWSIETDYGDSLRVHIFGNEMEYDIENNQTVKQNHEHHNFQERIIINKKQIKSHILGDFYIEPKENWFVEITDLDTSFIPDLKYATSDNFMKQPLYDCQNCLIRYEVAKLLVIANEIFRRKGKMIKLWDCYRPLSVQQKMWEFLPNPVYVADPNGYGSVHNRGGAVDITLVDKNGTELDMGTKFDYFGSRAFPDYKNLPDTVLANRELLISTMKSLGFRNSRSEWWHFSHPKAYHYQVSDFQIPCY